MLLLLLLICGTVAHADPCANAGCLGTIPECPAGTTLTANVTLGGCCPGCVTYLGLNARCSEGGTPCAPGLVCNDTTSVCEPSDEYPGKCKSYDYRPDILWSPECEADGTYSAVQCKGERITGRCFCQSEKGERIFGQQWWSVSENMTCACSRRVAAIAEDTGRIDITIHCDEEGNFEELQCDDGVCWCSDTHYGDALAEVVPETLMTLLPCYNETVIGSSYLRKCDSALSALNKIREEMRSHGTLGDAFTSIQCGLDGSYGAYQFSGGTQYCTWKDNSKIASYMSISSQTPVKDLTCNCARDTVYYDLEGHTFTMQCNGDGNYIEMQVLEEDRVCVDKDGYAFAEPIEGPVNYFVCPDLP